MFGKVLENKIKTLTYSNVNHKSIHPWNSYSKKLYSLLAFPWLRHSSTWYSHSPCIIHFSLYIYSKGSPPYLVRYLIVVYNLLLILRAKGSVAKTRETLSKITFISFFYSKIFPKSSLFSK